MIISKSTKPEYSLYFLGAKIIKVLRNSDLPEWNSFSLYEAVKNSKTNYSLSQHFLALDWLYLLGVIVLTPDGNLKLCS